ncbi:D-sedoheptulose-7-phosphate isomerase [Marinactinospora thermotolerans]|uniref:Phosphoheptose isomerase n=1 Tax=Marinactinospora thermotolerans DSM 45154 TaxID=1122192 RepID=A0A1T4K5A0_9ACTN|nr:SIS domain-containing protein [Marinactinospora thermotolerans]SJZ37485.1 phosphoheptose isomerase [Marinactinospora thermotolerans DSM 45154]
MHPHLTELQAALRETETERVEEWGRHLAGVLAAGGRLLVCGNGGSAAEAQHLTAELVGRFESDRRPLAAIALHADTSSVTAIANDYGYRDVFARQVRAHGRPGDVLMCLSTSGASENVIIAAMTAREIGLTSWALTGATPSTLPAVCDATVRVASTSPSTVQEVHLALIHLLCSVVDSEIHRADAATGQGRQEVGA